MKNKQTAVEWLVSRIKLGDKSFDEFFYGYIEEAKQIHKQQIIDAIKFGQDNYTDTTIEDKEIAEQYYNETFVAQK
tara:strand:- start:575 stop:802 length:228 start_codon:yes stop_codon:yes gene_type:complete